MDDIILSPSLSNKCLPKFQNSSKYVCVPILFIHIFKYIKIARFSANSLVEQKWKHLPHFPLVFLVYVHLDIAIMMENA